MNERRSLQLLAEKYELVLEGTGHPISDDIRNQIINMFRQGAAGLGKPEDTDTAILAQRFKVSRVLINKILRQSGFGRGVGFIQKGSVFQHSAQRITPTQIKYINNLISKRDAEGVFEHSISSIIKMVNEYTDAHPELNWYKIANRRDGTSIDSYIKKWEKENIPGKTRADYGIRKSSGSIYRRGTGQRIRAPRVLDPNDNSYKTAHARGQPINDQDFLVKGS